MRSEVADAVHALRVKRNNMCSRTCYKADAMFGARAVGEKLTTAARLAGRAVCVIGSEDPFPGSGRLGKVDRCIARVVCNIALDRKAGPVTFGLHAKEGICPGGQMWCGLAAASPMLKFFLSTGTPEFMGGAAEHLKPTPEAAERFLMAPGRITLPGRYLSLAGHDVVEDDAEVLSLVLFGTAESMRNLSGLVHYVSDDIFTAVLCLRSFLCIDDHLRRDGREGSEDAVHRPCRSDRQRLASRNLMSWPAHALARRWPER